MKNSSACWAPDHHHTKPLNTSARAIQKTVHNADSRSDGSWESRWNTNMSNSSKTAVPAQKATQPQAGTTKGGAAAGGTAPRATRFTGRAQKRGGGSGTAGPGAWVRNHRRGRDLQQRGGRGGPVAVNLANAYD